MHGDVARGYRIRHDEVKEVFVMRDEDHYASVECEVLTDRILAILWPILLTVLLLLFAVHAVSFL